MCVWPRSPAPSPIFRAVCEYSTVELLLTLLEPCSTTLNGPTSTTVYRSRSRRMIKEIVSPHSTSSLPNASSSLRANSRRSQS